MKTRDDEFSSFSWNAEEDFANSNTKLDATSYPTAYIPNSSKKCSNVGEDMI